MSGRQQQVVVFSGLRGRDGHATAEIEIPANKARECRNIDFYRSSYARRRGGAISQSLVGSGFTSVLSALHRHVPGADDTKAELWGVDTAGVLGRLAPTGWTTTPWYSVTWASGIVAPWEVNWVSFNGKLYILADSAVDRLQVFDPTYSPNLLRLAGLNAPLAPVVADTGTAGTYPATPRWYRVTFVQQVVGGIAVRRSNASLAATWTPSGSKTGVVVTRPDINGNGETHWELWGSESAEGPFYFLQLLPIATTTATDTELPADYYQHVTVMPLQGDNTPPWSAKYGIADDNRLLLAGAWEPGHSQNEVWFSPVVGSTSPLFADDERFPSTNKISFNERDSSYITALGGPIGNTVIVFKNSQTWRLMPTGDVDDPYRRRLISKSVGCLHQRTVVVAEDDTGIPTIYWLSAQGPYRYNLATGLARLTWDIEDIWETVNIDAATVIGHGVSHPDKHQVWWWLSTGTDLAPSALKVVFDTKLGRVVDAGLVRDGWSTHDGQSAKARCSVMFSRTYSGTSTSRDLKPYIGQIDGPLSVLWQCDTPDLSDNGIPFRAYVQQPARHLAGLDHRCQVGHPTVVGSTGTHVLWIGLTRDYGETGRAAYVSMAPVAGETRALRVVEGVDMADAVCVAMGVGDFEPLAVSWVIDAVMLPFDVREPVVV